MKRYKIYLSYSIIVWHFDLFHNNSMNFFSMRNITKNICSPYLFCIAWIDISTWALKNCLSCQVRVSEYNNIRSQLNAINRKQTGRCGCFTNYVVFKFNVFYFLAYLLYYFSLAVRDLSNLVKPEDIITSEHLTTLLAIVSKYSQKDWLESYETLTSYVVRYIHIH